jgi:UDP-N-acetyl-D-mannosaminuronic acid transferase (WecB/TagA/CpsF family)
MKRRLLIGAIGGVLLVGATGALVATAEPSKAPVFIAGDQAVTEDQVRQKWQSEGYSNVQIVRQDRYFEAIGSKDGQTSKISVDSKTGRLRDDDDDDDD